MAESSNPTRTGATVTRGVDNVRPDAVGTAAPATGDAKGALIIADRVGAKIARRAALDIDGVTRYSNTIGSLLGPGALGAAYPAVRVDMSDTAPLVEVTVALTWPCAVAQVCRDVRAHVADELARLTGIRPSRVDVTVGTITTDNGNSTTRDGYVELPAPSEIENRDSAPDDSPSDGTDTDMVTDTDDTETVQGRVHS
ncbi:Asp23/Gls24 family envelope stress response protein [Gordonia sp. L191]|uniref:Asp23/Gls24 family envelope stress response protein n=1 Tax=Gordonia sp. L191 TaxID=2982699 RepID=UPI0024C07254|nr:Asp23/Gls24 family envelope stress response protein [Gordonia sp. L191]WHU48714.1 Asp23/Gls24 family envelope stress response protein [Gordonia sp. L191]